MRRYVGVPKKMGEQGHYGKDLKPSTLHQEIKKVRFEGLSFALRL